MKVRSIITGSWFPRTKLHLKEFYVFLNTGVTRLPLDISELKRVREELDPQDVEYVGGRFDQVTTRFGEFKMVYTEDGLLSIMHTGDGHHETVGHIKEMYEKLANALAFIFKLGLPMSETERVHVGARTIIVVADEATKEEVAEFMTNQGDQIHFVARHGYWQVYFANRIIFITDSHRDPEATRHLVESLLFFREFEHKLGHLLDFHRLTWEAIAALRTRKALSASELPKIRDQLVNYQRELMINKARLTQMTEFLEDRRGQIDELNLTSMMQDLEAYRFSKMTTATHYLVGLWHMLEEYVASTIKITELLYQENTQREMRVQEFIFLIAAVSSTIALGSLGVGLIEMRGSGGQLLATAMQPHFNWSSLALFGLVSLIISIAVFAIIRPLFSAVRRIRPGELIRGPIAPSRLFIRRKRARK